MSTRAKLGKIRPKWLIQAMFLAVLFGPFLFDARHHDRSWSTLIPMALFAGFAVWAVHILFERNPRARRGE